MGQVPRPRCRRSGRRNGPQAECTEPAMSQVTTPTQPGWLPDPSGRYEWRYWDGGWTNRVANSAPTTAAPPPTPAPFVPAAPAAAMLTARDAVPRVPFGADPTSDADVALMTPPREPRRTLRAVLRT